MWLRKRLLAIKSSFCYWICNSKRKVLMCVVSYIQGKFVLLRMFAKLIEAIRVFSSLFLLSYGFHRPVLLRNCIFSLLWIYFRYLNPSYILKCKLKDEFANLESCLNDEIMKYDRFTYPMCVCVEISIDICDIISIYNRHLNFKVIRVNNFCDMQYNMIHIISEI